MQTQPRIVRQEGGKLRPVVIGILRHRLAPVRREAGGDGTSVRDIRAAGLKVDDQIVCSTGVAKLESVVRLTAEEEDMFEIVAITFKPDLPAAAFSEPAMLLTKGCAHARRGRAPVARNPDRAPVTLADADPQPGGNCELAPPSV